jgi:hypothetical protein
MKMLKNLNLFAAFEIIITGWMSCDESEGSIYNGNAV